MIVLATLASYLELNLSPLETESKLKIKFHQACLDKQVSKE